MKRDIKKENEIINKVMDEVKILYVKERLNNIGHGYTDFLSTLDRIENNNYLYLDGGIMDEFNKYALSVDDDKFDAVIVKFVNAYYNKVEGFKRKIEELNFTSLKGVMKYGEEQLAKMVKMVK